MLSRLARWWLARATQRNQTQAPPMRVEECERCGEPAEHRIVSISDDDATLGITDGGTAMAADFCAEHCPGGCRLGCVPSAA